MSTSVDTQGWSRERLDSAIRRRMNAAQQLASNPEADQQELAKVNEELDSLFAARRAPVVGEKKEDEPTKIIVEGVEYVVPDKFTMGEMADIEEIVGGELGGKANLRMKVGMVWITLRRTDPSWTLERVRALDWDQVIEKDDGARPPSGQSAA